MYDLKGFRQAFNLTQKQLAEILKCQQSNISGMEKTMRDLEPIQKKRLEEATGMYVVRSLTVGISTLNKICNAMQRWVFYMTLQKTKWENFNKA